MNIKLTAANKQTAARRAKALKVAALDEAERRRVAEEAAVDAARIVDRNERNAARYERERAGQGAPSFWARVKKFVGLE